jgi:hypothetical protein
MAASESQCSLLSIAEKDAPSVTVLQVLGQGIHICHGTSPFTLDGTCLQCFLLSSGVDRSDILLLSEHMQTKSHHKFGRVIETTGLDTGVDSGLDAARLRLRVSWWI